MPRALRVCTTSGCTELSRSGKCDECKRKAQAKRNAATQRVYDSRWRALSAAFLRRYPTCWNCGSKATDVDHKDGNAAGPRRYDWANLQALCHACHSSKTARYDGGFGRWFADGQR